ncbi:MAG: cell division protein SepF [Abditibacteriales bacterium]|nr:cell division protein SepF [Abditibacteriales bacterium]MDW8364843.1 cell division protein SepF [Abditibacteriales bacterium]
MRGLIDAIKTRMWYGGEETEDSPEEVTTQEPRSEQAAPTPQRRTRLLKMPHVREKQIYTMKPAATNEVVIAADYLKAGCPVFLNLQHIDRLDGQRVVDVMTGVCYGIDGHYYKVGDRLFFFVPRDYNILSDDEEFGSVDGLFVNSFLNQLSQTSNEPLPTTPPPPTPPPPSPGGRQIKL